MYQENCHEHNADVILDERSSSIRRWERDGIEELKMPGVSASPAVVNTLLRSPC